MKTEQNAFPASNQSAAQPSPRRLNATLRWLLSFTCFLALFAVLITLISYGFISLGSVKPKQAAAAQPANSAPSATPAPGAEPPALPSGTTGHVAGNQAQSSSQPPPR